MGKYADIDYELKSSGDFQYIDEGDGPILLLLHGLFGALSNFKDLIDGFGDKYRVIVPLMPIYDLPVLNTDIPNLTKFVEEFVKMMNISSFHLLGNSLGGHIALVYTSRNQDRINSLTLTSSSGLYENTFGDGYPRKGDKGYLRKKIEITFYDPNLVTDELVEECFSLVNDRSKLIRILSLAKSAIRHNMAKELSSITVPTCLIWGRNDQITPPEVAEEFNRLIPNSVLNWIDKCGHAPMMEHPQEFNKVLNDWLDQLDQE